MDSSKAYDLRDEFRPQEVTTPQAMRRRYIENLKRNEPLKYRAFMEHQAKARARADKARRKQEKHQRYLDRKARKVGKP